MEVMERCLFQCNLVALKGVLSNDVSTLVALTACLDRYSKSTIQWQQLFIYKGGCTVYS